MSDRQRSKLGKPNSGLQGLWGQPYCPLLLCSITCTDFASPIFLCPLMFPLMPLPLPLPLALPLPLEVEVAPVPGGGANEGDGFFVGDFCGDFCGDGVGAGDS
jgi:hypothetical protein